MWARRPILSLSILGLKRVQNARLWRTYAGERHEIARKNGGESNERELWHSTGNTPADVVCKSEHGFDPTYSFGTALRASVRCSGTDGNKYGVGVYLPSTRYTERVRSKCAGGSRYSVVIITQHTTQERVRSKCAGGSRTPYLRSTFTAGDGWKGVIPGTRSS